MDIYATWFPLIVMGYSLIFILTMKIVKMRAVSIALVCVYSWGLSGLVALMVWHFQQQWLVLQKGDGRHLLYLVSADHYHAQRVMLSGVGVLLLIPVILLIWCWFDRRKEGIIGKSSQTA